MPSRTLVLTFLAGGLVVALLATTITAVVQARSAAAEAEQLERRVADLERQVEALEAGGGAGGLEGLLDGLLGGDGGLDGLLDGLLGGDGDLGGLLDGLLGGDGGMGGMLGGVSGQIPGIRCMSPGGGMLGGNGGLDGLLGGDGGLGDLFGGDGGLGGLFGGDSGSGLDGLLGGGADAEQLPADPDELVTVVADQVAELRELEFERDVEVEFLDDDELAAELERVLDEGLDPDELAGRTAALAGLRAIPADADLEQLQRDLLEGQVAGYYAPLDEQLVVRTPEGEIRPLDRVTLAHELGHALVDQAIGLPDLDDGADADAHLGRLAVVEGDATLLMNFWTLQHLSLGDQLGMAGGGELAEQQEQLASFPHLLQRELIFPYTVGLDLACDQYLDGGWAAVDDAYADPPVTSASAMWPERAGEQPAEVPALTAPSGATVTYEDTLGAAHLLWLFEAPGGDPAVALDDPIERAAAWAGGEIRVWDVGGDDVVGVALAEVDDATPPLCTSVIDWWETSAPDASRAGGSASFGPGNAEANVRFVEASSTTAIVCDDSGVRLAVAPTEPAATAVVGG